MNTLTNKFYYLLLFCLTVTSVTFSQNYLKSPQSVENELKSDLNNLFQDLDKSKITSGLLSNYALELTELAPYNGVLSDTNRVSMPVWINLYRSIYSAKINNLANLATPDNVASNVKSASVVNNAAPLAILHYEYDCFNESAVKNGWLTYSGGRLRDVAGKPSPYLKKQLFAVAPKECIFNNGTVAFVFKSDLFYRNNSKTISGLYINFDNNGWQSASWNTAVSHTFTSGGNKTIQFRIRYSDGSEYSGHTTVFVQAVPLQLRAADGALYTNKRDTVKANSLHSGGIMEMHLRNPALGLRKPLIIAEPFDMSATLTVATPYNLDYIISQAPDMKSFIETMEYDVVYVNYNNGLDDIFRNAELFKEAIRRVNDKKDKTLNHPNVVIGVSMGGLVARYALRSMETEGIDHDTWKYISLDSPHKGANLPLGLQAMVRHVESLTKEYGGGNNGDVLNQLFGVLNATATKQMLVYYCASDGSINNSVHNAFQTKYDAMGFPKKCQNIAVSNGALQGNILFNPYAEIFNYQPDMFELMSLGGVGMGAQTLIFFGLIFVDAITMGWHSFKAEFSVHALPDRKVSNIYNGYAYLKKYFLLGIFSKTYYLTQRSVNSEASMLPLDGAAGSFNDFDWGGKGANDAKVDTLLQNFKEKAFTFVPTSSALALSNWDKMLNTNFTGRDFYSEGLTEFDEWMITPDNKKHPDFAHAATFLAKHLAEPPLSFNLSGTDFYTSVTVPLKNPANYPVSWSATGSFSVTNKTNTSAVLFCDKPNITGMIVASTTVTNPKLAAILGVNSFTAQLRKRMVSHGALSIVGDFPGTGVRTVLRVNYLQSGIPVSWKLSDTSNIKIVSSAADSALVEISAYNKKATITATVSLADKQVSVSKELVVPAPTFSKPVIDCRETEVSLYPLLSSYESVEWTTGDSRYVQIVSGAKTPKVKIKGLANTGSVALKAQIKAKGESFTVQKYVTVAIAENLSLYVVCIDKKSTPKRILVRAIPGPHNTDVGTFKWSTSNGIIRPCVSSSVITGNLSLVDFVTLTDNYALSSQTGLSSGLRSLVSDVSETTDNVTIQRAAASVNNQGTTESLVLKVSTANPATTQVSGQFITVQNPITTTTLPPPNNDDLWMIPPDDDPSFALLTYPGGNVTVTCKFVSPCNETLSASVFISGANYNCSYTSGTHSITVVNENSGNTGSTTTGTGGTIYSAYVYDDYGLVKKVDFSSSLDKISIPMAGCRNGFYYVNIVDSGGNVITAQTVHVQ